MLTDLQELIELRCARSALEGDVNAEESSTSKLLEVEKEEQTPQSFDSEFHMENPGAAAGRETYLNGSLLSKRQGGTEFSMNLIEIDEDVADVDADTDEIEVRERKVFEEMPLPGKHPDERSREGKSQVRVPRPRKISCIFTRAISLILNIACLGAGYPKEMVEKKMKKVKDYH